MFKLIQGRIKLPKYKIDYNYLNMGPFTKTFSSKDEAHEFIEQIKKEREQAETRYLKTPAENNAVVFVSQNDSLEVRDTIPSEKMFVGEWANYTFRLDGANYGIENPIMVKFGGEDDYHMQVRGISIYNTSSPDKKLVYDHKNPNDVIGTYESFPDYIPKPQDGIYTITNWWALILKTDTDVIPAGTSEITVEVDAFISQNTKIPDGVDTVLYSTWRGGLTELSDFENCIDSIDQSDNEWADGEGVFDSTEAAQAFLNENRGRWKNREERLSYLRGQDVRRRRNERIDQVDIVRCNALNVLAMRVEEIAEWQNYKQALRDVPQQKGFPDDVVWPDEPG